MNIKALRSMSKEDIYSFIRERLAFDCVTAASLRHVDPDEFKKEHRRFEMSGYEGKTGECTVHNLGILNEFADLGIYDYTEYLFLDFHKGTGTLYLKYLGSDHNDQIELDGFGTVEIIYKVIEITVLSGMITRRRS